MLEIDDVKANKIQKNLRANERNLLCRKNGYNLSEYKMANKKSDETYNIFFFPNTYNNVNLKFVAPTIRVTKTIKLNPPKKNISNNANKIHTPTQTAQDHS